MPTELYPPESRLSEQQSTVILFFVPAIIHLPLVCETDTGTAPH